MFNLGMGEITVILLLALIFLGPKKLPELASGLGKIIKDIRKATADVKDQIQLDEHIRKPFEELRDAVTLPPEELKRRDHVKKEIEAARRKAEADLAALAASTEAAKAEAAKTEGTTDANGHAPGTDGYAAGAPGALPLPGMPSAVPPPFPGAGSGSGPHGASAVPPPFPGASSGPHAAAPVPPPIASTGSGPHGAVPPPFHHATPAPHAAGAGPHAAAGSPNPPHTVPSPGSRERPSAKSMPVASARPGRPPGVVGVPVPAPTAKPHAEKTVTTQFLSEADLIPPDAPPPLPPGVPSSTGKHAHPPAVPGATDKSPTASAGGEAAEAAAHPSPGEGAPSVDTVHNVDKKGDVS